MILGTLPSIGQRPALAFVPSRPFGRLRHWGGAGVTGVQVACHQPLLRLRRWSPRIVNFHALWSENERGVVAVKVMTGRYRPEQEPNRFRAVQRKFERIDIPAEIAWGK